MVERRSNNDLECSKTNSFWVLPVVSTVFVKCDVLVKKLNLSPSSIMKIYKDIFTGDEMFSDTYKLKLVDDVVYEVYGKLVTRKQSGAILCRLPC